MKITSGHDCAVGGCTDLAFYGMAFNGEHRWSCRAHSHLIGFTERPEASPSQSDASTAPRVPLVSGRAAGGSNTPAAAPSRFPSQGRLL